MQFEEEIIPDFELAPGECSSPQHQDDGSDDSIFNIYDNEMDEDDVSVHESSSIPKWEEKTIQVVGYLEDNPLDPRNTISQFHNDYFESEVSLS